MVTPLARRRPAMVARQLVALDQLSRGRMVLGVGLGLDSSGRELSAFGEELDARRRAAMLDEALGLVHELCSGEPVDHHGPHYRADHVRFQPASWQRPIPTWVAARWPNRAPLRRAARYEGVYAIDLDGPDELRALGAAVAELRAASSAAPSAFDIVVHVLPGVDPEPWAAAGATWVLTTFSQFGLERDAVEAVIDAGP
jgi:alkanesulfonate monooxygenase SsuD/methylene tetrahydromethanopterin reductase-like flavin-dependent oxidoreductase (luciferase family)